MINGKPFLVTVLLAIGHSGPVAAGPVEDLTAFTAGTPALADEVNDNFSSVADAVNDNDARIAALETQNSALAAEIAELKTQLTNVLNIDQYLSLETLNDQPAIRITGANLQLVNGLGETATANGTGNLVIGYDEVRGWQDGDEQCSLGKYPGLSKTVDNAQECAEAGGLWAYSHKGGSHYLVAGALHNYSRWGGIVVGSTNTSNWDFASVSGGVGNTASGLYSSVSGGSENTASGTRSSVSGGGFHTASGDMSSVSGGHGGTASHTYSSVSGGSENTASGLRSSVSGGKGRNASGTDDWVAGSLSEDN